MIKDKNSYNSIIKAIGLFGGAKVFQILINIIKNKIIAVLLGPYGMGISGMITASTSLISTLSGFGLQTSSVRDISQAYTSKNINRTRIIITVLRKLIIITGLIGTIITFFSAKQLSIWSFGNDDFAVAFRIVSVILFFDQLSIGQTVLMQATYHYKFMVKASLIGSFFGLVISIPIYYIWKIDAIAPTIIVASLSNLFFSWFYSRKIPIKSVHLSTKQIYHGGKTMLTLGLAIALTGVINAGQAYILRIFISNYGNIEDVGFYMAGVSITTSYIGVILTAMASDYSPRLAAVANDNNMFIQVINRQIVLVLIIISPLIIIFISFIKQLTILLFSPHFVVIAGMVEWMMFGMFFRAISWGLSFALVAKGESKIFFLNESIASTYSLLFSILGYRLFGFTGMGIAYCLAYIIYMIQMYYQCNKLFKFNFSSDIYKKVLPLILMSTVIFSLILIFGSTNYRYTIGTLGAVLVSYISIKQFDNLLNFKKIVKNFKNKIKNRRNKYE